MRVVWCLGLYASASTWLFNVLREMILAAGPVETHFISTTFTPPDLNRPVTHLIKTHEVENQAALAWLQTHASHILITLRDPRDAIASLIQYHHHDFSRALDHVQHATRLCLTLAPDKRSQMFQYETKFFDQPETLMQLDSFLGLATPTATRSQIFANARRENIDKYIASLPSKPGVLQERTSGDLLDPETHWHTHHANRTGTPGRWQSLLTPAQIQTVEQRLADLVTFR